MLSNLSRYVAYARKAIIQLIGLLTALLALGLLPDPYNTWVASAIGVLTTISHYLTPNDAAPGDGTAEEVDTDDDDETPAEWQPASLVTASEVAAANEQAAPPSTPATTDTTAAPAATTAT